MPRVTMVRYYDVQVSSSDIPPIDEDYFEPYAMLFDSKPQARKFIFDALALHPRAVVFVSTDTMTVTEWDEQPPCELKHSPRKPRKR